MATFHIAAHAPPCPGGTRAIAAISPITAISSIATPFPRGPRTLSAPPALASESTLGALSLIAPWIHSRDRPTAADHCSGQRLRHSFGIRTGDFDERMVFAQVDLPDALS